MSKQSIHIETLGEGPDIVFLHGWAMHSGVWKGILARLVSHYRVHLIDLPGHGLSPNQEPGDFDQVVKTILDTLPDRCTICGWSLGGQVAMGLALADPIRVKKLVLVSTTPCFVKHPDWPWGMEGSFLQFFMANLHQNFRTTINRFLTLQINGGRNSANTLAQLREYFFERDPPDYNALQQGLLILQTNDMRSKLHRITQPVLLLHGENDMITHPSAAKWMSQQFNNARLVLFPKCGHAPFITDPEKFVACIHEN
ncbi:MAG: pimeloyl-ACP methyl ester esterase BioH [Burkholderiales bacterium]|nr:pimeloyl-ACP methyl ester esterase BioH [Nitrosomonas sp.]MCP5274323.1 pimeloyl-ACP methyl ester esterase BioH [Burkholderiales bacterium]